MTNDDKTMWIIEKLGHMGRMISGSKSTPKGCICFFNANIYSTTDGVAATKLWHGDINLTKDEKKLREIAAAIGTIYVTKEMPFRFEGATVASLEAACLVGQTARKIEG